VTSCTISPSLPTGLMIMPNNCTISGMPTATTTQADYTVFPSNSVGVGAGVTISIGAGADQ
jgi:hypothetical protein